MALGDANNYQSLATADFNGDSFADIVALHWWNEGISILEYQMGGGFEVGFRSWQGFSAIDVEAGDLDLDGDADIIVDGAYIFENDGSGNFPKRALYYVNSAGDCVIARIGPDLRNDLVRAVNQGVSISFAYSCGDADGNAILTISDAVFVINFIFSGGPSPEPVLAADADCNGIVTISDAVTFINWAFAGGPAPCQTCR